MDGFGLTDDELTAADATLFVAAIDEDDGDMSTSRSGAHGPAAPAAARAGAGPGAGGHAAPGRRSAGGCAGRGCLLVVVALGAFVAAVALPARLAPSTGGLAWFRPMW